MRFRDGSPYNGASNRYFVPATDATELFAGDPVILAGSADVNGVATVTRATAGATNKTTGVVVGFQPDEIFGPGFREASTDRYVLVADSPDLLFEIQEDSVGGALAVTDVGSNANYVAGAGSTVSKHSGFELDSSTAAIGATLQCRIAGFVQRADNEVGANAKILVSFNLHTSADGTAGV